MILGLCGYARSGKNATASILAEIGGFEQVAFADALRELAIAVNPFVAYHTEDDGTEQGRVELDRYADLLQEVGYEEAKKQQEVREYLQRLGVGVREVFGADVWVNVLHERILAKRLAATRTLDIVITDVRFPNEARYVQSVGTLWRIVRPGTGPVNRHESELHQESFKVAVEIVANNLDELRVGVLHALKRRG